MQSCSLAELQRRPPNEQIHCSAPRLHVFTFLSFTLMSAPLRNSQQNLCGRLQHEPSSSAPSSSSSFFYQTAICWQGLRIFFCVCYFSCFTRLYYLIALKMLYKVTERLMNMIIAQLSLNKEARCFVFFLTSVVYSQMHYK